MAAFSIPLLFGVAGGAGLLIAGTGYLLTRKKDTLTPPQAAAVSAAMTSTNPQAVANVATALADAGKTDTAATVATQAVAVADATGVPIATTKRPHAPMWTAAQAAAQQKHIRERARRLLLKKGQRPAPPTGRKPGAPAPAKGPTGPSGTITPTGVAVQAAGAILNSDAVKGVEQQAAGAVGDALGGLFQS